MKRIQISLLLSVVVFATGCPKPKYGPTVDFKDQSTLVAKINEYINGERAKYDKALCANPPAVDEAIRIRNELIENALPYIDGAYVDFITDIQAGRDRNNFVLDLVELGTAASVGITKGERPLQIIGVALTAFRGGRRSLDANFYKDTSTPILISKMDGNRAKVRAIILEREAKKPTDYPLGAAIADIVDYYNAGTLVRAFTQLQQDTAVATQASEKALSDLKRKAGILGAPTAEEIKVSRENADAVDALVQAYEDAKDAATDADGKVTTAQGKIDTAQQTIDQERAKATPSQTVIDQATQARVAADQEKTAAEGVKTTAVTASDKALSDLKATYDAIEGDPALSPLLDQIPNSPGYSPAFKASLQQSLQRLKAGTGTVDDYASILLKLGRIVRLNLAKDPTLNDRLQTILKVTHE